MEKNVGEEVQKNWLMQYWKWWATGCVAVFACAMFALGLGGSVSDIAQAYWDPALCQHAIDKANQDVRVIEALGKLAPIDKLALVEGNAKYSDSGNSVEITVRVSGEKAKAKMDIGADKIGQTWKYRLIRLRIKTGEEILIN